MRRLRRHCALSGRRRTKEEIYLLEEKYRQILVSFEHKARVCAIPVGQVEEGYAQGATAYGLKQVVMYYEIAVRAVVMMMEVHRGRGKKRTPAGPEEEEGGMANSDPAEREDEDASDGSGGDKNDDEDLFGVNNDEEFFMGGEDEDDLICFPFFFPMFFSRFVYIPMYGASY
ncbi:hypothetical protein B0H16DRAFT_1477511 [Mycena metata]|uniref:Uncharacterized protein n=1 Tax=Mycena metata TaxID=1033252 RepID=A0AAD7H9R9_9AGAR|nr:hypothetical protein B0H16DRAFT_1477511 [Mycena metata]